LVRQPGYIKASVFIVMKHHQLSLHNGNAKVQAQPQTLIIMGVAGSGKSTVGKLLAA
jgi:adenylylsulfate kinase-like enzyme